MILVIRTSAPGLDEEDHPVAEPSRTAGCDREWQSQRAERDLVIVAASTLGLADDDRAARPDAGIQGDSQVGVAGTAARSG